MSGQKVVCPGDRLVPTANYAAGFGTYVKDGFVVASLSGVLQITAGSGEAQAVAQILRKGSQSVVPQRGDTVSCRVSKVNPRLAVVSILCLGPKALDAPFSGVIRAQDVRATEIDKVELQSCFRPGDLVRAEVLSLGDSHSYFLSTAKNELGVIQAKSIAGVAMVPISWQEMQCPQTRAVEKRKVAKQV